MAWSIFDTSSRTVFVNHTEGRVDGIVGNYEFAIG